MEVCHSIPSTSVHKNMFYKKANNVYMFYRGFVLEYLKSGATLNFFQVYVLCDITDFDYHIVIYLLM